MRTPALRDGTPAEAGMLSERIERVRELCAGWVESGHTPSLSVCVARRGVVVLREAWGRLHPDADSPPLEPNSLFALSSMTKPITATLLMQLVEDGLLGLNRPVRDYLPELSAEGSDEILVHHLLTHTSGYADHTDEVMEQHVAQKLEQGLASTPCPETQHPILHAVHSIFWDAPLVVSPGSQMIYSNHNYELLGEIVRRLSGRALDELARERLFGPLGMDDSFYVVPESESPRVMQRPAGAPLADPQNLFYQGIDSRQVQETPFAGGGVFSTPGDMACFGQAFLNGGGLSDARILSRASVAAMTRDQIPGVAARFLGLVVDRASWGYGWSIESPSKWRRYHGSLSPLGTFNHGGGGGVKLWVDPIHEIVGVYFEACLREGDGMEHLWNVDLFENAVTASVSD